MKLILGTRASQLALAQAYEVKQLLEQTDPMLEVIVRKMSTRGDERLDVALHASTLSKGLFTEELEKALAEHTIDLAVHSLKDLPVENVEGTMIGAHLKRVDARDVFLSREAGSLADLPAGAVVGTSSPRRVAQLRQKYPLLKFEPVRGNVGTRIEKMRRGDYAGLIMAAAGLVRLGQLDEIAHYFDYDEILPAPGQAVIAAQCRTDRPEILAALSRIDDTDARVSAFSERSLLAAIGGGCAVPLGALAEPMSEGRYRLRAFLASADLENTFRSETIFSPSDFSPIAQLAAELLEGVA